jgi:tetratricopeptide (TPR) repeat protein
MYYKKIITDTLTIEFHNDWLGEETVIINGQIVSRKSSVMGTHHDFTIVENGQPVNYILTTKVNGSLEIFIDVRKNGTLIKEDIQLSLGGKPKAPENTFKKDGITKVKSYHMKEGIAALKKALEITPEDPEIYFYLACAYSIEEKTEEGFECLKMAVKNHLHDRKAILNEHMLAYLRMNDEFENFVNSNFTEFDKDKM